MIVAIGVDVDETFARFVQRALEASVPLRVVNLRAAVEGTWRFDVPAENAATLQYADEPIELRPDDAFYCRLIDLSSQVPDANLARRWHALLGGLRAWLDAVPGTVVNRGLGGGHNSSKPLHEAVLRELGFRVPESITSCDAEKLKQFVREGPAVSKAVCGVRADTVEVSEADFDDFDAEEGGPVHLQRLVTGDDARIHVVGDTMVGQRVTAKTVDYRRSGGLKEMELFTPPTEIQELLVHGTRELGLGFAGWDFKIDGDGTYWCLEANPMPGYSPYDSRCDGAITRQLIAHLGGPA